MRIPVELASRSYDVLVGAGVRRQLAEVVTGLPTGPKRAVLVTHQSLRSVPWMADIDPGVTCQVLTIAEGEEAKSLATVEQLCRAFSLGGLSRSDVVIGVGGGVVTDVAGFAAAVYHRGVSCIHLPTTLLGQIDAAIGGKTGVNLPEGKNLVGAFWQPAAVLCDTETLATLPPREMACGLGEMAKYDLLGLGSDGDRLLQDPLEVRVARCAGFKAAVVAEDEREGGRRALLNYGHTLAHALEAAALEDAVNLQDSGRGPSDLRHGEAVAVGLVFAALLARRLGRIGDARVAEHRAVIEGFGLSADLPAGSEAARLVALMSHDKKSHHDLVFVLDGPAGIEVVPGVGPHEVLATLVAMGARP